MIESGFIPSAISHAGAMGLWQFIEPTGRRYGLRIDWWIDERRDYRKATASAIRYMKDLQQQFKSWYLVAASYNMGETGVRRLIQRHGTNSFWELADLDALPDETQNYVPKILAAMLIAKAPALYGFRDLNPQSPLEYDEVEVPGGTDLINLGKFLGVSEKHLEELNPELIKSFIPREVRRHRIRVPKGARLAVEDFLAANADSANSLGNDLASVDAASR
jgi:membrane-bound lytic murein transglycosylase D